MSVGLLVGGRYELRSTLGRGGFGTVWQAHDRTLSREVAVKIIKFDDLTADRMDIRRRFSREAQAVAALNHPNVVTAHDFGVEDNTAYLVMELIGGGSLDDELIDRRQRDLGPLDVATVTAIGAQVCAGLAAAHAAGLVHRDLKPANVMRAAGGRIKIVDFGIARDTEQSRLTQAGVYLGTLRYTSPEQMDGEPIDGRSDLYSLACVLFELLTGQSPYEAKSPLQWVAAHQVGKPKSLIEVLPSAPKALDALLTEMLAKSPDLRPATADVVRLRLERIHTAAAAAAVGTAAVPVKLPQEPSRPPQTAFEPPAQMSPPPYRPNYHTPQPPAPYRTPSSPPYQTPQPPPYQPPGGYAGIPQAAWPTYGPNFWTPPPRPVTVTVATALLVASAVVSATILVAAFVAHSTIETAWHADFDGLVKPGNRSDASLGLGFVLFATVLQAVAALILAFPVHRGSRVARVITWIYVVITSLCCTGTIALPALYTPVSSDIAAGQTANVASATAAFKASFPGWFTTSAITLGVAGVLALLSAGVLLAVRPSSRFYDARRFGPIAR